MSLNAKSLFSNNIRDQMILHFGIRLCQTFIPQRHSFSRHWDIKLWFLEKTYPHTTKTFYQI